MIPSSSVRTHTHTYTHAHADTHTARTNTIQWADKSLSCVGARVCCVQEGQWATFVHAGTFHSLNMCILCMYDTHERTGPERTHNLTSLRPRLAGSSRVCMCVCVAMGCVDSGLCSCCLNLVLCRGGRTQGGRCPIFRQTDPW